MAAFIPEHKEVSDWLLFQDVERAETKEACTYPQRKARQEIFWDRIEPS